MLYLLEEDAVNLKNTIHFYSKNISTDKNFFLKSFSHSFKLSILAMSTR